MALVLADRVQETSTTSGTGSITLAGAVAGFQTFAVVGNGNTTYYTIVDGTAWEVGIGTYSTTGPTLARTTVLSNSNGNTSPITLSGGSSSVFLTYPAEKSINLDASNNASALGTVTSGTWQGSTVGVAYGGTGVTASSGANSVVLRDASQNIAVNRLNQANTSVTAAGGTTALTSASTYSQTLNGTGNQTFSMPDATTLTTGVAFIFNNNATGTLTLTDYATATIGTLTSGGACELVLLANGTVGGTWDVHGFLPENVTWGTNALALGGTVITGGTWQGGTITSAYGGTGLTTFTGANNALYSTSASTLTAGVLPVAAGGTGVGSYTANGVLYASGAGTITNGSALAFDGTNLSIGGAGATGDRYIGMVNSTGNSTFGTYGGTGYGPLTSGDAYTYTAKNIVLMADNAASSIKFAAGGNAEGMRLNSTGLGVGGTPSYKLDVNSGSADSSGVVTTLRLKNPGTAYGDGARLLFTSGASTTAGAAIAGYGVALDSADMLFYSGGNTERMRLLASGNFGVGTTSPSARIQSAVSRTSGTNTTALILSDNVSGAQTSGYGTQIQGWSNGGSAVSAIGFEAYGGTNNDTAIAFYTQAVAGGLTRRVTIDSAGNLNGTSAITAISALYSPIFYDYNNTAYYVDPNSSTSANFYGSVDVATYNLAGLRVTASGTSSSGGAIAIQQITGEGWTGIFCDFEPYTEWALWHDNPNNYFSFTGGDPTNAIRSFTVPSRSSGNRTAYEKFRIEQGSGSTITGGIAYAYSSMRAPIFYDLDDTGYYIDPNSTSNSALRMRGGALFGPNTTWSQYLAVGTNGNTNTAYASVSTTDGNLHLDSKSGSSMYLNYYAGTNIYFCNSNTIKGTFDSSGNLTVNGNVTAYSDERLKKDWSDLSSDFVSQLATVQSGTYTRIDSGERQVGVGAQSLQAILKEAVSDKDEYLGVHYGHAALASSVELAKYVTALEQRISQLETRL